MTAKKAAPILFIGTLLLLFLLLFKGDGLLEAGRSAALLTANAILPSLFPFLVLSRLLSATAESIPLPGGKVFRQVFGLPEEGLVAFLLGALCGFPIGVKISAELYQEGRITREEATRLSCLSANTGPAFAVVGVGGALFGDTALGWRLYAVQLLSAVLLGILTRKAADTEERGRPPSQGRIPPLSDILYSSSLTMLGIAGTVIFFSTLSSLLTRGLSPLASALLTAPLEVGSAAAAAARLPLALGAPLAAFSLSFSGASVLLQSASLLTAAGLPTGPLVRRKLLGGAIAAVMTAVAL